VVSLVQTNRSKDAAEPAWHGDKYYGRNFKLQTLEKLSELNREGVSLVGIVDAAENWLRSLGFNSAAADLKRSRTTLHTALAAKQFCVLV